MAPEQETRRKVGSETQGGQPAGQSAAELADAILEVIERGGRHAWVEVVELCARARTAGALTVGKQQSGQASVCAVLGREALDSWCYAQLVTDSQIDQLIAAARELSPAERLRVAQRVLEGLPAEDRLRGAQDAGPTATATSAPAPSMLGLFADEPELVDDVCRQIYADRGTIRPRPIDE